MNKSEFENIIWPEEFFIEFKDGERQHFVSSQGIIWDDGQDNDGADENRPSISCCWQKKSPSQQTYRHIEFFVDEIVAVKSLAEDTIWNASV
jgi:hypothetical protein